MATAAEPFKAPVRFAIFIYGDAPQSAYGPEDALPEPNASGGDGRTATATPAAAPATPRLPAMSRTPVPRTPTLRRRRRDVQQDVQHPAPSTPLTGPAAHPQQGDPSGQVPGEVPQQPPILREGAQAITFPGVTVEQVPLEVRSTLKRIHQNLSHPPNAELLRWLAQKNASGQALLGAHRCRQHALLLVGSSPPSNDPIQSGHER